MWRRPQNNPAVPVPTYYPDDGADTHCHSPRRKSFVGRSLEGSSGQMSNISAAFSATNPASFPAPVSALAKGSSSGTSLADPFSEAAYQEWITSLGLQSQQHAVEPTAIWPGSAIRNSSKQSGSTDTSMANMPEFLAPVMTQNLHSDAMAISGPSLDDEHHWDSLKVPTNTPTTLSGDGIPSHGSFYVSCCLPMVCEADRKNYRPIPLRHAKLGHLWGACQLSHTIFAEPGPSMPWHPAVGPSAYDSTTCL